MKWLGWLFAIVLFVLIVGFTMLNSTDVTVNCFVLQFKASLGLVLTLFFIMGGVLGLLIGFINGRWKRQVVENDRN
jgi:uncharacterized integral membrane protein